MNNYNQHHKNLTGGSFKQSNMAGSFCWVDFQLKKWLQKRY